MARDVRCSEERELDDGGGFDLADGRLRGADDRTLLLCEEWLVRESLDRDLLVLDSCEEDDFADELSRPDRLRA
ncbi:MAG: hypothetical protein JXM70_22835 [Pirellulales bacterium]|nr:hypothetical protein [Pirellulales bacterium]